MGFFGVEFCIRCYAIDMKPARFEFQTRLMHRFIALWLLEVLYSAAGGVSYAPATFIIL